MKSRGLNTEGIKNAQKNMAMKYQEIQERIETVSEKIGKMDFIGSAYDGVITTKFTGEKKAVEISIKNDEFLKKLADDKILKKTDLENKEVKEALNNVLEYLSDLLIVSINDAIEKVDKVTDENIENITKGMNIAGLN